MSQPDFVKNTETPNGSVSIEIDAYSGFCFGVVNAINLAEKELQENKALNCLGNIVHNEEEVSRLTGIGLEAISYNQFQNINDSKVLFRAHGEPPESYRLAQKNNIKIIDATCPVVLKLQKRIKEAWQEMQTENGQVIIYGKHGHAEVLGLVGQTENQAIVVETEEDLVKIDKSKTTRVFSQTTMSIEKYNAIAQKIVKLINKPVKIHDTICRQVANRAPKLRKFVKNFDLVLFVSGTKSSNGKYLFSVCKTENENTFFVSGISDIQLNMLEGKQSIGICGATSTPMWLMEKVANEVESKINSMHQ